MKSMTLLASLVLGVLVAGSAGAAKDPLKRIEEMCRIAAEELDLGDASAAEMRLSEAIAVAKSSGLTKHAVTARAHLYLAAAHAAQNNKVEAVKAIRAAFAVDPKVALPEKLKTPELKAAMAEARGFADPGAPSGPPMPPGGIQFVPIDSAPAGKAIPVEAQVGDDVKPKKVMLFFKGERDKAFKSVPMKNVGTTAWKAEIAVTATGGAMVSYYVDARNAKGKVVATRGTASKPYVISVVHAPKVVDVKEEDKRLDDEDPLKNKKK